MKNNLHSFQQDLTAGKIFYFAGSGISLPSRLPSVEDILDASIRHFLPTRSINADNREWLIRDVQPEAFYGTLLDVFDGDHSCLGFWKSLHPAHWSTGVTCRPNLVHLTIVKYSSRAGQPIFTTNFDTMFEQACDAFNLPYRVLLPKDDPPSTVESGTVLICKVHGSISDPITGLFSTSSLHTTMADITSFNPKWCSYIAQHMKSSAICFVGYSGRDVDYFPQIRSAIPSAPNLQPYWFDRFGNGGPVAAKTFANAKSCNARLIDKYPSEVFPDLWGEVFPDSPEPHLGDSTGNIKTVLEALSKSVPQLPVCEDLFWLRLLESQGRCNDAWHLSNELLAQCDDLSLDPEASLKLHETAMNMAREKAKFSTYRRRARTLLRVSRKLPLLSAARIDAATNARIQITSSFQMEIPTGLGTSRDFLDLTILLLVMTRFRTDILRGSLILTLFSRRIRPATRRTLDEARIREAALYVGLCSQSPALKHLLKARLIRYLNTIYSRAYRDGNFSSLVGASKYLFRLTGDAIHKNSGNEIARLAGDVSAQSIFQRDYSIVKAHATDAIQGLQESVIIAHQNGNTLNEIKARIAILWLLPPDDDRAKRQWRKIRCLSGEVESWNLQRSFRKLESRFGSHLND